MIIKYGKWLQWRSEGKWVSPLEKRNLKTQRVGHWPSCRDAAVPPTPHPGMQAGVGLPCGGWSLGPATGDDGCWTPDPARRPVMGRWAPVSPTGRASQER